MRAVGGKAICDVYKRLLESLFGSRK